MDTSYDPDKLQEIMNANAKQNLDELERDIGELGGRNDHATVLSPLKIYAEHPKIENGDEIEFDDLYTWAKDRMNIQKRRVEDYMRIARAEDKLAEAATMRLGKNTSSRKSRTAQCAPKKRIKAIEKDTDALDDYAAVLSYFRKFYQRFQNEILSIIAEDHKINITELRIRMETPRNTNIAPDFSQWAKSEKELVE